MDNKKYDDLDKLFQSRLKNDQIVNEKWNQPPKAAFEGAMGVLDKQNRKKRRRIIAWIFGAIVLAGFILLTFNNFNKINKLESRIAILQNDNENKVSQKDQLSESSTKQTVLTNSSEITEINSNNSNQNIQDKAIVKSQKKSSSDNPIERGIKKADINKQIIAANSQDNNSQQIAIHSPFDENSNDSELSGLITTQISEDLLSESIEQKNNFIASIPFLPLLPLKELINKNEYQIQVEAKLLPDYIQEEECESDPLSIYTLAGVNASSIKMTNTEGADFILTGYEKYYADAFTGLGVEYRFHPRWSVDLQATYNKLHVKSTFEDEIAYDASLEFVDNQGNKSYNSMYDVFTVMGRQSGDLAFSLENVNIDDQDEMMNQTKIDNSFATFGLSLAPNYKLYCNEKWSIDMGLGLQYNHLLNVKEEMETNIFHENGLMLRESVQSQAMDNANRNYWSMFANMRIAYSFSEHYGFRLELGSTHSLSSIRKTYSENDSKTYINNLKASLQFYYSF